LSSEGAVARLRSAGARGVFAPCVPGELAGEWLVQSPRWFGPARVPVPGAEAHPHLARIDSPLGPLVVKREPASAWRSGLARLPAPLSRGARAARAFELGRAFRSAGIGTPEPLAWIEARTPSRAHLLLVREAQGESPWRFLAARPSAALVEALARAIAELHARGFRHRDLKAPNLLVREEEGALRVVFLDLDGAARVRRISRVARARDLARLAVSFRSAAARSAGLRADAWPALVEAYARAAGAIDAGALLAWTERWARAHVEANLRRGRPIA
jgi:tRNA A-37 threonylcarbamoyl transferase component Bud32